MKKVVLIVAATFLGFNGLRAQEEGIRFGAKAGLNISNFSISLDGIDDDIIDEDDLGTNSKLGFHIGFVVEIPVSERFAFQPELLFSSQGAKSEDKSDFGEFSANTTLSYLNLPLMLKTYVAEGFSIEAGPQLGLFLSGKTKTEEKVEDMERESDEFDIDKDDINGIDIGLLFGLGYQLDMGLFFQGRYNLGLSNINDTDNSEFVKQRNRVISLSVGYKF